MITKENIQEWLDTKLQENHDNDVMQDLYNEIFGEGVDNSKIQTYKEIIYEVVKSDYCFLFNDILWPVYRNDQYEPKKILGLTEVEEIIEVLKEAVLKSHYILDDIEGQIFQTLLYDREFILEVVKKNSESSLIFPPKAENAYIGDVPFLKELLDTVTIGTILNHLYNYGNKADNIRTAQNLCLELYNEADNEVARKKLILDIYQTINFSTHDGQMKYYEIIQHMLQDNIEVINYTLWPQYRFSIDTEPQPILELHSSVQPGRYDFLKKCMISNPEVIQYVTQKGIRTDEYDLNYCVLEVIKQHPQLFKYVNTELTNNKDFMLEVIKQHPQLFKYVDTELTKNKGFMLEAIKYGVERVSTKCIEKLQNEQDKQLKKKADKVNASETPEKPLLCLGFEGGKVQITYHKEKAVKPKLNDLQISHYILNEFISYLEPKEQVDTLTATGNTIFSVSVDAGQNTKVKYDNDFVSYAGIFEYNNAFVNQDIDINPIGESTSIDNIL